MISRQKTGLFGGSFDPIHHGHLIIARQAMESLGLDRVIFIPANISPHKLGRPPVPPALRCEMVRVAIAGEPGFSMDDCEAVRNGPSYAVDTAELMVERHPSDEFYYFIGEDNLPTLDSWRDIERLKTLVRFVILSRGDSRHHSDLPCVSRRIDISSTDIRNRIARGLPVRYLLPDPVCEIIRRHQLYLND